MWESISNVSGLITCILFIAYIIGHIWAIHISRNEIIEDITFERVDELENIEDLDIIDLAGENGKIFSIVSPKGIRNLKVFGVELDKNSKDIFVKGDFIKELNDIKAKEKVYFKGEFLWYPSNIYIEFERIDYIKVSLIVGESGKDGSATCWGYKTKMGFKSWLYYLCK